MVVKFHTKWGSTKLKRNYTYVCESDRASEENIAKMDTAEVAVAMQVHKYAHAQQSTTP